MTKKLTPTTMKGQNNERPTNEVPFVGTTINSLTNEEIRTWYNTYNYLIDITEKPKQNIFVSQTQALLIHRSLLQSKLAFVKALYIDEDKWNNLLSPLQ